MSARTRIQPAHEIWSSSAVYSRSSPKAAAATYWLVGKNQKSGVALAGSLPHSRSTRRCCRAVIWRLLHPISGANCKTTCLGSAGALVGLVEVRQMMCGAATDRMHVRRPNLRLSLKSAPLMSDTRCSKQAGRPLNTVCGCSILRPTFPPSKVSTFGTDSGSSQLRPLRSILNSPSISTHILPVRALVRTLSKA